MTPARAHHPRERVRPHAQVFVPSPTPSRGPCRFARVSSPSSHSPPFHLVPLGLRLEYRARKRPQLQMLDVEPRTDRRIAHAHIRTQDAPRVVLVLTVVVAENIKILSFFRFCEPSLFRFSSLSFLLCFAQSCRSVHLYNPILQVPLQCRIAGSNFIRNERFQRVPPCVEILGICLLEFTQFLVYHIIILLMRVPP